MEKEHDPNPYQQDENNIRMENDPRVEGVNKLIQKLKKKEIDEQA